MVIILPNKVDGLAALTETLDEVSTACSTQLAQAREREVRVFLPRFRTESKLDLKATLSQKVRRDVSPIIKQSKCDIISYSRSYLLQMGLDRPFSNYAEFNGISDLPLTISKVVQKAFIEVNEEGSEAAAVTGKYTMLYSLHLPKTGEILS